MTGVTNLRGTSLLCFSSFGCLFIIKYNQSEKKKEGRGGECIQSLKIGTLGGKKMIERAIISFLTFGKCLTLFFVPFYHSVGTRGMGPLPSVPLVTVGRRNPWSLEVAQSYLESYVWNYQTYTLRFKVSNCIKNWTLFANPTSSSSSTQTNKQILIL